MNKKGVEISINVIIIAAIALMVLVILSMIFIGRLGIFTQSVGECENKGGKCVLASDSCPSDYPQQFKDWACVEKDKLPQKCCVKVVV